MTPPTPCDLREAFAMWELGILTVEELPRVAEGLLELENHDSASLARLAANDPIDWDSGAWLRRAMNELGLPTFADRVDAANWYVRRLAHRIAAGDLSPSAGAAAIWEAALAVHPHVVPEADPFIYAWSELEERPEDREHFELAILKEARRIATGLRAVPHE